MKSESDTSNLNYFDLFSNATIPVLKKHQKYLLSTSIVKWIKAKIRFKIQKLTINTLTLLKYVQTILISKTYFVSIKSKVQKYITRPFLTGAVSTSAS